MLLAALVCGWDPLLAKPDEFKQPITKVPCVQCEEDEAEYKFTVTVTLQGIEEGQNLVLFLKTPKTWSYPIGGTTRSGVTDGKAMAKFFSVSAEEFVRAKVDEVRERWAYHVGQAVSLLRKRLENELPPVL